MFRIVSLVVVLSALSAACTETRYTAYDEGDKDTSGLFYRDVEFQLTGDYYKELPTCAIVLPFTVNGKTHPRSDVIEAAVARQMSGRLDRVIGPRERDRLARRLALAVSEKRDQATLARESRCPALIEITPWGGEDIYALVWTQSRIGLELRMLKARDRKVLWQARHVATRSEGGLPLSPFSALYNAVTAARFTSDGDVSYSLADDAVRRMIKTLPDSRL